MPGKFLDTYRRYKANPDHVIRWLVDNSGLKVEGHIPANILLEFAKSVPPRHYSEDVLRIIDHGIEARIECAVQYRFKVDHRASIEAQEHFSHILKYVRRSLRKSCPATATYHSCRSDPDPRILNNRFELLELQHPVEWADHTNDTSPEEQVSAVEDGIFAHFCFLLDCHRVRKQVRLTSGQCRDKKISVTTAGLTTNIALDNIIKLHYELVAVFPAYPSYEPLALGRRVFFHVTLP